MDSTTLLHYIVHFTFRIVDQSDLGEFQISQNLLSQNLSETDSQPAASRAQDYEEAENLFSLFDSSKVTISPVEEGIAGLLKGLSQTLEEAKGLLREGRLIVVEQIYSLALRLKPEEVEKARRLIRDEGLSVANGVDGITEAVIQPVLSIKAQELVG